ncbi:MAG: hypothetical protein PHR06_10920 [Candidatus Cloacimonetes bacterium]|nr:hypothetical protein [Candidatus Cloacimonadota bacterium]
MLNDINRFFEMIKKENIELYNESGLQHELALYLRYEKNYDVKLEYPVSRLFPDNYADLVKRELDILIKIEDKYHVIELKMPKNQNAGTPNAMYNIIKDVKFLEQLSQRDNFSDCYSIIVTSNTAFWNNNNNNLIYTLFGTNDVTIESIQTEQLPPFLQRRGGIELDRQYKASWNNYSDWRYYIMKIERNS